MDEVDLSGYTGAVDDFDVLGVSVALTDSEGNAIESDDAVETPADSGRWVYAATVAVDTGTSVRIAVTAHDRPGGVGEVAEEKTV